MTVRVAVLGGSAVVTPQLVAAIADDAVVRSVGVEFVLVGRSREKLDRVVSAARRFAGSGIAVVGETDLEAGLGGAEFVVNQIRAGGLAARAFDESFPHGLGLPGEETMGPGGFANAWRTLPVVRDLFGACARIAPKARVLNLTNPAGMVHQVAVRAGLDTVTFCDSPITLARGAAVAAGIDAAAVTPGYVGTNHGGWLTSLRDAAGYDHLQAALVADGFVEKLGFDPWFVRRIGALPNVYLRYLYAPERQLAAQRAKGRGRAEELLELEQEALGVYGAGGDPGAVAEKRRAVWYTESIGPALGAFIGGRETAMIAGVANAGLVSWLSPKTMLEVPLRLDRNGAAPSGGVDELAVDVRALLAANAAYEDLAVEALLHGDREDRVRALAVNPMVGSLDLADRAVAAIEAREGPTASA